MTTRTWTAAQIRALGVRTDLVTAASILGIGRTTAYELARAGEFPTPVVKVRAKYVVLVAPLLRALGLEPESAAPDTGAGPELAAVPDFDAPDHGSVRRGPPAA